MSLTEEGLRQRKWGRYPNLEAILGDKPPSFGGLITSIDDSLVGRLDRLVQISNLLQENLEEVVAAGESGKQEEIRSEVEELVGEFKFILDELRYNSLRLEQTLERLK